MARLDVRASAISAAVFVGGAVLLGVEIAASRVLAPFFGNSLFVWGALIGVVLAGLAVGYWVGGALADRLSGPRLLVWVAGAGALTVLAIPLIDEPVLEGVVGWDPGPRLDPLLASIALFGAPSVLLAAVTPIAIRLRARSLAEVGSTSGRLFGLSTAGSIFGTFAAAFFLIPEVGTDQLFALAAGTLLLAVAFIALAERMAIAGIVLVAASGLAASFALALAPDAGGTLSGAEARNWSPLDRLRGQTGILDPRDP